MDRKILMLINFFPPAAGGGVYRPLSFVRYLSRHSWDVTVVTPERGESWILDSTLEGKVPAGVRVIRTKSLSGQRILNTAGKSRGGGGRRSSSGFGLLRRLGEYFVLPDTYAGWIPFAAREASRLCESESFDVLYSTSPPDSTHLAAVRLSKRYSIPWVADFRDPWIALHLRDSPTPFHRKFHEKGERQAADADAVLVTTDWQRSMLLERYPGARVVKIANGYDEEDFEGLEEVRPQGGPMRILHCGMLTLGRRSDPFIEGLSLLIRKDRAIEEDISVEFIGARESANEEYVRRTGLEKVVRFRDNIPHSECVKLERESHVLLLIKHDDERYRGLVPGKLFEYIGARRPMLAVAPEGEAASIVRDNRRGEVVSPRDPEAIARAIDKMYRAHLSGSLDGLYDLRRLPELTRRAGAEMLAGLLDSLTWSRGPEKGDRR